MLTLVDRDGGRAGLLRAMLVALCKVLHVRPTPLWASVPPSHGCMLGLDSLFLVRAFGDVDSCSPCGGGSELTSLSEVMHTSKLHTLARRRNTGYIVIGTDGRALRL